ncbi:hypothetical protein ACUHOO_000793 [Pseudomonas aeruginosa]|jgi:hypothetical protein|uniref:hypothetical protein n=1 Tax=Pseudomonas aeruginosa TaxID=287 RepID=UPI0002E558A0|nr:hypothetical protein [Pseudomonas aeruginosa]EIU3316457.1 hypothetical protein [Pseudomonas aeruginosa]EIY2512152.1 hypothetical protein [Pseudomonas aeruginosa]EIY2820324.1 hypothetical protein [Pseudomonas aeruginosa]EKT8668882.1 hypothetical protein [Pseudomonas aeruginosa]EKU2957375.1 hypothetical protein [Pseudomonas aeruginosa]
MQVDVIRAGALLLVAAIGLAVGWQVRGWKEVSDAAIRLQAEQDRQALARSVVAQVAEITNKAIAGIRVTNTTIYQTARREIVREPMDPACRLPAGWMRNINAARAGKLRPEPAATVSGSAAGAGRR